MSLRPVLHRLYVKPYDVSESDERIKSAKALGIVVETDKREQKAVTIGTIVAIGSTAFREFGSTPEAEGIKVGSKVLYAKYAGSEVPNEDYILLNDEDLVGVYTDE